MENNKKGNTYKNHLELARMLMLFFLRRNPDEPRQSNAKELSLEELRAIEGAQYHEGEVYFLQGRYPLKCSAISLTVKLPNGLEGEHDESFFLLEFKSNEEIEVKATPEGLARMREGKRLEILERMYLPILTISSATRIPAHELLASDATLCKAFDPLLVRAYAPELYLTSF